MSRVLQARTGTRRAFFVYPIRKRQLRCVPISSLHNLLPQVTVPQKMA